MSPYKKILLEDVFTAYFDCRRNKRRSKSALAFEVNYEQNCVELWEEINNHTYTPGRSISFVITKPVQREIFAANFRDRVVHHLIINRIEPLLEAEFIDETTNCRKGKGTHYGIRTLENAIQACSERYTKECWILKLDIKSFFMSINKQMLLQRIKDFLIDKYQGQDKSTLLYLVKEVVLNAPEENCIRRSPMSAWKGLPRDKSLFTTRLGYGIPIGNLTSQVLANFFLNEFDHWMKSNFQFYGRYVDDFYIVSSSKDQLRSYIPLIKNKLLDQELQLHPCKIYIQNCTKGVKYIGSVIKPNRTYIANRTRNNYFDTIQKFNLNVRNPHYVEDNAEHFACSINSYLGMMKHYATYAIRRKSLKRVDRRWWEVAYISGHFEKVSVKKKYKSRYNIKNLEI